MTTWLEILFVCGVVTLWIAMELRIKPRRDQCNPLTNEQRMLQYIERRAAWECQLRKRKLLQRQRVERMLERRYLDRHFPTVPSPLAQRKAA